MAHGRNINFSTTNAWRGIAYMLLIVLVVLCSYFAGKAAGAALYTLFN